MIGPVGAGSCAATRRSPGNAAGESTAMNGDEDAPCWTLQVEASVLTEKEQRQDHVLVGYRVGAVLVLSVSPVTRTGC